MNYSLAPNDWAICFQNECPMADACLRHAIGRLAPADLTHHTIVLPAARQGDHCTLFVSKEPVLVARGMQHLLPSMPAELKSRVLRGLYDIFGSRAQYYRYREGRYPITPEQQHRVTSLFRSCGIRQEPVFDTTSWGYVFPCP